jgi:ferric-dicitrate binding protein FerR (iron transport regulator)
MEKIMTNKIEARRFQRGVALVLCFFLSPSTGFGFSDVDKSAAAETVGKVTGVASVATRNGTHVRLKDVVWAKDNLTTDNSGRMSIELQDGSILNVGSDTQFRIVNHDSLTGETLVDLSSGRLRSRVVKVRGSGKFEISTPHATITALGTDFLLDVSAPSTQVIVYSGVVVVTAGGGPTDSAARLVLDVAAGQDVVVDGKGISHLELTADNTAQQTMAETTVPEPPASPITENEPTPKKSSHAGRNTLIAGLAVGAVVGAALGLRGAKSQSTTSTATPIPPPTIPAH